LTAFGVDWRQVFVPDTPPLEIVVRGTIMYMAVLLLLRFVFKRRLGALGVTDLIVIVFIADAAQNGMAGDCRSLTERENMA